MTKIEILKNAAWRAGDTAEFRRYARNSGPSRASALRRQKALIIALCRRKDIETKKLFFKG